MATLRELRQRIKSVGGIRQITRAMEMVSATKLRRAQQRIESARPYTGKMDEILAHLAKAVDPDIPLHPLMEPRKEVKKLLIIGVASNKGLCGSFNANVIRKIELHAAEAKSHGIEVSIFLIGRKLMDFFKRRKLEIHPESGNFISIDENLPVTLLQRLMNIITDGYLKFEYDQVDMIYTEFRSAIVHKIVIRQFLPIVGIDPGSDSDTHQGSKTHGYIFEPDAVSLFKSLIPKYARVVLFRMLADSFASEHGGRMGAMHNATKNAGDMIRTLTLQRNKARQSAITKELAEIVGGAEALTG
jgi:F-type H+-transporting ATPase subunit gamma